MGKTTQTQTRVTELGAARNHLILGKPDTSNTSASITSIASVGNPAWHPCDDFQKVGTSHDGELADGSPKVGEFTMHREVMAYRKLAPTEGIVVPNKCWTLHDKECLFTSEKLRSLRWHQPDDFLKVGSFTMVSRVMKCQKVGQFSVFGKFAKIITGLNQLNLVIKALAPHSATGFVPTPGTSGTGGKFPPLANVPMGGKIAWQHKATDTRKLRIMPKLRIHAIYIDYHDCDAMYFCNPFCFVGVTKSVKC